MKQEETHTYTTFIVDPDLTLIEAWEDLSQLLAQGGAREYQIDAMKMAFFMGAAQAYQSVDAHSRSSRDEFNAVMEMLDYGITTVLKKKSMMRGNA